MARREVIGSRCSEEWVKNKSWLFCLPLLGHPQSVGRRGREKGANLNLKKKKKKSEEKKTKRRGSVSLKPICSADARRWLTASFCQDLGDLGKSLCLFPTRGGFCPDLVGLSLRAINTPCNMRGDTLISPNMRGALGRRGQEGREGLREERGKGRNQAEAG